MLSFVKICTEKGVCSNRNIQTGIMYIFHLKYAAQEAESRVNSNH